MSEWPQSGPGRNDTLLNRHRKYAYRSILAVAAMPFILDLAWTGITVAAEKVDWRAASASSSLFVRQPLGFSRQTINRLEAALRNLPDEIPKLIEFVRAQRHVLGAAAAR